MCGEARRISSSSPMGPALPTTTSSEPANWCTLVRWRCVRRCQKCVNGWRGPRKCPLPQNPCRGRARRPCQPTSSYRWPDSISKQFPSVRKCRWYADGARLSVLPHSRTATRVLNTPKTTTSGPSDGTEDRPTKQDHSQRECPRDPLLEGREQDEGEEPPPKDRQECQAYLS